MIDGIVIEVCCGSICDVSSAAVPGVDRIELNSALELGGLTPSLAEFRSARKLFAGQIVCMCRPRPAGFCYQPAEIQNIIDDAKIFLENGADGIVFGVLNPDHTVQESAVKTLCEMAHSYGKEAVFHKAFDETPDPYAAIESLIHCGIRRVLTSGQAAYPTMNTKLLHDLQSRYGSQIEILPGGGVTEGNIRQILSETGCRMIHMSAREKQSDSGSYDAVSQARLRRILHQLTPAAETSSVSQLTGEDLDMLENDAYEDSICPLDQDGQTGE